MRIVQNFGSNRLKVEREEDRLIRDECYEVKILFADKILDLKRHRRGRSCRVDVILRDAPNANLRRLDDQNCVLETGV